jgi:PAS domain S-box-containing protein
MREREPSNNEQSIRLSVFIRRRQREIVALWTERVRKLSPARHVSSRALVDHVPIILDHIAEALEPGEGEGEGEASAAAIGRGPTTHALERLRRGYDLEEVIQEYTLLRCCILDLWSDAVSPVIDLAELRGLEDAIEQAMLQSAGRFSRERERMLQTLDRISEAAFDSSHLDDFFDRLLHSTLDAMESVDCVVILLKDGDVLRARARAGLEAGAEAIAVRIGEGFAGTIAASARPLYLQNAAVDPLIATDPLMASAVGGEKAVRALYGLPLRYDSEVMGVAYMGSRTAFEFSEEDRLLFSTLIDRAALVIESALLATRDRAYNAAARAFARARTFDEAIAVLLPELGTTLGWDVGAYWRVDRDSQTLEVDRYWQAASVDVREFEAQSRAVRLPRGDGLPGRAWDAGAPIYVAEFAEAIDFPRHAVAGREGLKTALAFPLVTDEGILGVIEFLSRSMRWSSDEGVHLTTLIAEHLNQFTRRIAAQEALRKSSARHAALLDAALDCVISIDAHGCVLDWNSAAEGTFGYSRADAAGREVAELIVPPRLRSAHRAGLERYLRTGIKRYLDRRVEIDAVRRDGTEFPVELTISEVRGSGVPLFTAFIRDITQAKEAERERARLLEEVTRAGRTQRFLAQASQQLAASLDYEATLARIAKLAVPEVADWCAVDLLEDGNLRRVSVAHVDAEKVELVRDLAHRYPPDPASKYGAPHVVRTARSEFMAEISDALLVESARDEEHLAILRRLGLRSYISTPIVHRGSTLGVISFVSAESELRYGEGDVLVVEELALRIATAIENAKLYSEAQAAVRSREDLLAIVSHDLRSPLAAIAMSAEALALTLPADAGRSINRALLAMRRSTGQMERLIGDLLDTASIQAGRLSVEARGTELFGMLCEALERHEPMASEADLRLASDVDAIRNTQVVCDRQRILQALSNLLGNAIKFTPPGGTVTLSGSISGGEAIICVADTGPGVSSEELEQVFQPYWTRERQGKQGIGLGLYIAKGIIEAHGGRIGFDSEPDSGATFRFTLPLGGD